MINKRLEQAINEKQDYDLLAGANCPKCGYPIVIEMGLEVCYCCGWSNGEEETGYYDE